MKSERRRGGLEGNQNSVKHNRYGKKMLRLEDQVRSMIREHRILLDGLKAERGWGLESGVPGGTVMP